jgi:hypothetical protein
MHRFHLALALSIAMGGVCFHQVTDAGATAIENAIVEFVVAVRSVSEDGTHIVVGVDSVYQVRSGKHLPVERLYVDCPSNDLLDWRVLFKPGNSVLDLKREVTRVRSRGWLFWGGKGEMVILKAPEKGWNIECACRGKKDKKGATLFGVFRVNGRNTRIVEVKGKDRGWPGRLIPFKRGGEAEVQEKLRLICAWTELEKDQESVVLERTH